MLIIFAWLTCFMAYLTSSSETKSFASASSFFKAYCSTSYNKDLTKQKGKTTYLQICPLKVVLVLLTTTEFSSGWLYVLWHIPHIFIWHSFARTKFLMHYSLRRESILLSICCTSSKCIRRRWHLIKNFKISWGACLVLLDILRQGSLCWR